MPLGAEGVVQFFHGVDGVVHRVQLTQQPPGGHGFADVHHRAPDNHRRRNADKQPHHARVANIISTAFLERCRYISVYGRWFVFLRKLTNTELLQSME